LSLLATSLMNTDDYNIKSTIRKWHSVLKYKHNILYIHLYYAVSRVCLQRRLQDEAKSVLSGVSSDVIQLVRWRIKPDSVDLRYLGSVESDSGEYVRQEAQSGSSSPVPQSRIGDGRRRMRCGGSQRVLGSADRKRKRRRTGSRVVSRERWRHGEHPVADRRGADDGWQTEATECNDPSITGNPEPAHGTTSAGAFSIAPGHLART